jgi:hypothetical protein
MTNEEIGCMIEAGVPLQNALKRTERERQKYENLCIISKRIWLLEPDEYQ